MAGAPEDDYSDLIELGIDAEEAPLARKFNKCLRHIQAIAATLDNATLLQLYGLYKQSLVGPCNAPKPNWYDLKGKSKWEAWKLLGDLDQAQAMENYIQLTLSACPGFSLEDKAPSWVAVSAPVAEEGALKSTVSDHIRNGDLRRVALYLEGAPKERNRLDGNGLGLVHYASDIGDSRILELLLKNGCDVNLQDSEGQTALHYATSCGNADCVGLLLEHNADKTVRDSEGVLAADLATDARIRQLFSG